MIRAQRAPLDAGRLGGFIVVGLTLIACGGVATTAGGDGTPGRSSSGSGGSSSSGSPSSGGASSSGSASSSGGASSSGTASSSGGSSSGAPAPPPSSPFFVSPTGSGTACSKAAPCSIAQAQLAVRAAAKASTGDLIVELADGTYRLDAPLVFGAADSGTSGHPVVWQAAAGAHPVISGARRISGWSVSDTARNIWKASAPGDFATRQLFVDGRIATRARVEVKRSDLTFTTTGFRFSGSSAALLDAVAHPERMDLHAIGSFTDRYSPVKSIANGTATMVQPAWANNTWGWDTIPSSFRPGPVYLENAYELLDEPGEWYLDGAAGTLYYNPLSGQDLSTADVELPRLEVLVVVGGTLDAPAHDLAFRGLTFSHTSWLAPSSSDGYPDQQTGAFIAGTGYPEFEATRPKWHQMPAAVQVSAAARISFERDRFVALGQGALGIGNDDNAHSTGVGLGVDTISVTGCVFSQLAAAAITVGGIQENAHHPADARMVVRDVAIANNLVHDAGVDYRGSAAILFTYTQKVVVSHNEVFNLPYSAIASGYGWGSNDAGGSDEYANRGLYRYQPRYTTATTAKDNRVEGNLIHHAMLQMNDGGCHYNLSANPGTVVTLNYCNGAGSGPSGAYNGYYADEGSRFLTITRNVFTAFGTWGFQNANASNRTGDLTVTGNWVSGSSNFSGRGDVVSGNTPVDAASLPADARAVVDGAGLEAPYADLRTTP